MTTYKIRISENYYNMVVGFFSKELEFDSIEAAKAFAAKLIADNSEHDLFVREIVEVA